MISSMSIQIDGVEYLTTAEAVELAGEMGHGMSKSYIARAARNGRIKGCSKIGEGEQSPWLLPKPEFTSWLRNRNPRGRPKGE